MSSIEIDLVTIGKIERPFGVKGAVKVRSLSDVSGRFDQLRANLFEEIPPFFHGQRCDELLFSRR